MLKKRRRAAWGNLIESGKLSVKRAIFNYNKKIEKYLSFTAF
jgi:hypothetical protein